MSDMFEKNFSGRKLSQL